MDKKKLSGDELAAALLMLPEWQVEGQALARTWKHATFPQALAFIQKVGVLAEEQDHHPDIDLRYVKVTVRTWSHDAGGITQRDVKLARAIDAFEA
ncbi:MAG: 4a-hydroxytetrahydrobiopterin dehydratase [Deltaproteobacteria bacterium]|nr:4a-hydroxytetrahydrobiopterin dehydratase [Deltaproteobacteria bacterium]